MERKLTLTDICGYLPYGLKIKYDLGYGTHSLENITSATSKHMYNAMDELDFCDCIPILRPLSDLYRTITNDGKEICPIVELAKISYPDLEWKIVNDFVVCDDNNYTFDYDIAYNQFYCVDKFYHRQYLPNQYQLFDYLHELKIDFRNLIESGLAVSVYDIENNCYK